VTHLNSKRAAASKPIDYASIARIASAVELRDIALRSSRAALNVAVAEIPEHWSGEAFVGFETTVGEHLTGSAEFSVKAAFVAVYKSAWSNEVFDELPSIDPADPPAIEIRATFELDYLASDPDRLVDEDLNNFALTNGTLHAWPYWRELAEDLTQRMHVPRLVVGVFKLPSRHDPGGRPESGGSKTAGEATSDFDETEGAAPAGDDAEAKEGGEAV
jgi:hypothetical protein